MVVLNRLLRGWANYFRMGTIIAAYESVDQYAFLRLPQWWRGKHNGRKRRNARFSYEYMYRGLGLVQLHKLPRRASCAYA